MFRTIAVAAVAAVATLAAPATAGESMPVAKWQTTACQYEDSVDCYWNAKSAGNGAGHSFYAVTVGHGRRVCILYTGTRYAHRHNYCTANPYR